MPVPPPGTDPGRTTAARWRWLAVALGAAYVVFALTHLGGAYWDTDEGLNLMKGRLLGLGYPLYSRIWSDQPPGYTVLLAGVFAVAGPSVAAARAVTFAFAVGAMAAAAAIARRLGGDRPAMCAAAAAVALAPNAFWAARAAMIGLPALAVASAAMAAALAFAAAGRRRDLALAGLLLGASAVIKPIGAVLVVPIGVAVWLRRRGAPPAAGGDLTASDEAVRDAAAFSLAAALPLAAMLAAFDARALLDQVVGTVAGARGAAPLDLAWNAEKLADWLVARDLGRPGWSVADHAFLVAPAAAGLAVALRRRPAAGRIVAAWLAATVAALLLQNPLWPKHHFLALLVVLAPLFGVGLAWAVATLAAAVRRHGGARPSEGPAGAAAARLAAALVVAAALAGLPAAVRADAARLRAVPLKESGKLPSHSESWRTIDAAVAFLRDHTAPGDWVVTDHAYVAFRADRPVPPELAVISSKRIATGALAADDLIRVADTAPAAAVLLWDGDRLQPAFPAFVDWVRWNYDAVDGAPAGWTLYVRRTP